MAVQFVLEDGSGVLGANAFCSLAFALQFHEDKGTLTSWSALSDDAKKQAIIAATQYLTSSFQYIGRPLNLVAGYLAWPRWDAFDAEGVFYEGVPLEIQQAAAWLALKHTVTPLDAPIDTTRDLKSVAISGALDVEWNEGASAAGKPRYDFIDSLLYRLVQSGVSGGSFGMGRVIRG